MVSRFFKAPRFDGGFIPFAECSDTQVKQSQDVSKFFSSLLISTYMII